MYWYLLDNKVSGKAFASLKTGHLEHLGISFGSKVLLEEMLLEVCKSGYMYCVRWIEGGGMCKNIGYWLIEGQVKGHIGLIYYGNMYTCIYCRARLG